MEALAGQALHVAGANGVGKSTLLRVLAGLLQPEQGRVLWQGRPIHKDFDRYAASFGYLGHSDALKADLSARENLAYGVGLRRTVAPPEIDDALARVGLSVCRDLPARVLSAGQRRRLALTRILLTAAALWILDEPFTNLDQAGILLLSGLIAGHLSGGGSVIMAAHQSPAIPGHTVGRLELA